MDLVVRNAKLRDRPGTWDIGVQGERVTSVTERLPEQGRREIDAGGRLVAPTYVNGHVHLDKSNLGDIMRPNKTNSFQECLEITWEHKRAYTVDDVVDRTTRAVREGILNGTTIFRAFADVDTVGGLRPLEGLLALRRKWHGIVDIQVVDFPQ